MFLFIISPLSAQNPESSTNTGITNRTSMNHEIAICGTPVYGPGLPPGTHGLVDRFNNPWHPEEYLVKAQLQRAVSILGANDCSGFRIDFEDVILHNGIGFDDQTPVTHPILGSTTRGAVRRQTVCEVFAYIDSLVDMKGSPDILIRASQMDGSGFLGAAGPFFVTETDGYNGGTLFDHITTGVDPTPGPGNYDATIIYDFGFSWFEDWSTDPGNQIDLYSVTLHEITHALGFMSLIRPDGSSAIGGAFSLFDRRLMQGDGTKLIDPVSRTYQGDAGAPVSNSVNYQGEICGDPSPVYSPDPWRQGSSMSHFDPWRSGIRYVMRPSTGGGPDRRYTNDELNVLCELGYSLTGNLCSNCAPKGIDDFASTLQGEEVCVDVLANDLVYDGSTITIDPASVRIVTGGGSAVIRNGQLCYTPSASFVGLAILYYAPLSSTGRAGREAKVLINVTPANPPEPVPYRGYNRWYFGDSAGVDFSTGSPVPLTDGKIWSYEGCATQSNPRTGALQFYSNGERIWDSSHSVMPNGEGLHGQYSSTQSVAIVPMPRDSNQYYVFTSHTTVYDSNGVAVNYGIGYSIVDMRLNGGKGDVVKKNVTLIPYGPEKLVATRHCNGRDFWVLTHEIGSDAFLAYPVTPKGVGDPVVTHIGNFYRFHLDSLYAQRSGIGYLKVSPDGTMIAAANSFVYEPAKGDYYRSSIELFDFDNSTGTISNVRTLRSDLNNAYYGVSFSPDSRKLYVSSYHIWDRIMQFDLSDPTLPAITNSLVFLTYPQHRIGALQLAPDGKIYVNSVTDKALGAINNPDSAGTGADLVMPAVHLGGRTSTYGLPNLIDYDLFNPPSDTAALRISKRLDQETVRYNDTISYTIQICNDRVCGDAENIVIEDQLPDGLDYVDGFTDYPRHTIDLLRAGECREVTIRALVTNTVPLDLPITNCAGIVSAEPEPGYIPSDNSCATFTLHGLDLGIEKTLSTDTARLNDLVTYSIDLINYGPIEGTEIELRDLLPDGLIYVAHRLDDPAASYDPLTGLVSIPALSVSSQFHMEIDCRVGDVRKRVIENCASIESVEESDLDLANNRSCVPLEIIAPDLLLEKSVAPERPLPGQEITYTIRATNRGNDGLGPVTIVELLSDRLRFQRSLPSGPGILFDRAAGTIELDTLAAGEERSIAIICRLADSAGTEPVMNCVEGIELEGIDPDLENNAACVELFPRICPDGPEVILGATVPHDLRAPIAERFEIPIILYQGTDDEFVPQLVVELDYDPENLLLEPPARPADLLIGTIIEGWEVISMSYERGHVRIAILPPSGPQKISGVGKLLRLFGRMYIGSVDSVELVPKVAIVGNGCLQVTAETGSARLDSICGLNFRLIEMGVTKYAIARPAPDPFVERTRFTFSLGLDGQTNLRIYDESGREVAILVNGFLMPGEYSVEWDGTGRNGEPLPAGLYFYRCTSGQWKGEGRMVLVR